MGHRFLTTLCISLLLCRTVHAQAVPNADSEAKQLFAEGARLYAEARYVEARDALERSFELSARPLLLLNLGNVYERMGDFATAADRLRRFLPDAPPQDESAVRLRIAYLDEQVRREAARQAQLEEERSERARTTVRNDELQVQVVKLSEANAELRRELESRPPLPAPRPSLWDEHNVAIIAAGTGAAFLVSGSIFGALTLRNDALVESNCPGGLCLGTVRDELSSRNTFAILADISFAAAALAFGSSAYLFLTHEEHAPQAGLVIAPAGVGISGRF